MAKDGPQEIERPDKLITIKVNTKPHPAEDGSELSYREVVRLAFPNAKESDSYTVRFTGAAGRKSDGHMTERGPRVKVQEGTAFRVSASQDA